MRCKVPSVVNNNVMGRTTKVYEAFDHRLKAIIA